MTSVLIVAGPAAPSRAADLSGSTEGVGRIRDRDTGCSRAARSASVRLLAPVRAVALASAARGSLGVPDRPRVPASCAAAVPGGTTKRTASPTAPVPTTALRALHFFLARRPGEACRTRARLRVERWAGACFLIKAELSLGQRLDDGAGRSSHGRHGPAPLSRRRPSGRNHHGENRA